MLCWILLWWDWVAPFVSDSSRCEEMWCGIYNSWQISSHGCMLFISPQPGVIELRKWRRGGEYAPVTGRAFELNFSVWYLMIQSVCKSCCWRAGFWDVLIWNRTLGTNFVCVFVFCMYILSITAILWSKTCLPALLIPSNRVGKSREPFRASVGLPARWQRLNTAKIHVCFNHASAFYTSNNIATIFMNDKYKA